MKKRFLFVLMLLLSTVSRAQYTEIGKIEYERKVNMLAQLAEMENNDWIDRMKAQMPKFMSSYFDLTFDTARSIYKQGREVEGNNPFKMFGGGVATENVVLTDFNAKKVKASKKIFESKFFVEDSMRVMDWQEKEDIRTIAGYKCHKAVSKICDTVYVVAFYAEDILVSGGPESFSGLPGMILELAIPRLHTTWTATKVELTPPKPEDFTIVEKGKKVTQKQLYESVKESFKAFGNMGPRSIWWSVL